MIGTYIHGLFADDRQRSAWLARLGAGPSVVAHDVLVEDQNFGRTRTNYRVHVNGNVASGEEVRVRITNAQRVTLEGDIQKN